MLNILTINTWKCDGDYFNRLEVLKNELNKVEPDVILLQESFQSVDEKYDTTRFLADKLSFYSASSQSRTKERMLNDKITDSYSNVSILSIYPIIHRYIISLPSNDEDGGREAIAAEISVNGKKILVISVHLSHLRGGGELRIQQLLHIIEQPFFDSGYDALFIGGDFNCIVDDLFLEALQHTDFEVQDTFVNKSERIDYTYSNGTIFRKIDHILQFSPKGKQMPKIIESKIVFNEPDPELGIKVSDHNGVIISVEM